MIETAGIKIGGNNPFVLIAGPCVVETEEITFETAAAIEKTAFELDIPFIFKSSYRKANRTDINSYSGMGDEAALDILGKIKNEMGLPILTDIHHPEEAPVAAGVADILQIPAFLCRQTDLLIAAGNTGKVVNIKKGQFLSPYNMKNAAMKVESTGNNKIIFTERGTTFGYNNLVVDMRSLIIMRSQGYPVVMDATHSVQMPGSSNITGGAPEFIEPLAKAAAAVGIDALFLEVHPNPPNALSDASSQLPLDKLKPLLEKIKKIDDTVKSF